MKSENIFKAILQKYGFPSVEKAGVFGENIAYKSIMKLNVSEQYLDSVENLFNKKLFDPLAYAMIKDKYLYMKDKKQEFGTLLYYCENDSKWELSLYPVSDFKNLNQRRKEIGILETVEDYANRRDAKIPKSYYK